MDTLEQAFHSAMQGVYLGAKTECGYNATRFMQMVANDGGLQTARRLLRAEGLSEGFVALWEFGRLDLTVEALVIAPRWRSLFSGEEIQIAQRRLDEAGWNGP